MKNGIKYIIFIIVVICCAGGLTMSYLHAHYKETGEWMDLNEVEKIATANRRNIKHETLSNINTEE